MRNLKKLPAKQLERFSAVFIQLGLVLTLFVVYVVLEHETVEKNNYPQAYVPDDIPFEVDFRDIPIIIVKKVPKPKTVETVKPEASTNLTKIDKVKKEEKKIEETFLKMPEENDKPQILTSDDIKEEDEDLDPIIDETVPFLVLEDVPVYKGCEGLSKEKTKVCFTEKINKHVQRNFDVSLAQDLGLESKKYNIYAQFIIDTKGNVVDVKIKAPHKRIEKEVQKLVDKIPQFTPGKQRGTAVKVKYTLPISFQVQ